MEYKRLYIAYGSNINLEQMANRCPNSKVIGNDVDVRQQSKGNADRQSVYACGNRQDRHCAERKRRSSCFNMGDRRTR